jgi:hypothetical protein
MKKAIVEFNFNKEFSQVINRYLQFDIIESFNLLEMLKLDLEKGIKVVLIKIEMKQGHTIHDMKLPEGSEIISILDKEDNIYTCLIKGQAPFDLLNKYENLKEEFDLNVKWDTPTRMSKEKIVMSAIGDPKELEKFVNAVKIFGDIQKLSFQKIDFDEKRMLQCLTDKQRQVVIAAKKNGYYDYPRKINSEKLAETIGISKTTTIEHLRKAESRLISNLLLGY